MSARINRSTTQVAAALIVAISLGAALAPPRAHCAERALPFEIVDQERAKKGASLDPLIVPKYVLFRVKAVLTEAPPRLTEATVRATLRALLKEVRDKAGRRGEQIDGVSAFLYKSRDHIAGGSMALGLAEWWPKGHSFSPDNVANIKDKATYVEKIDVFLLPKAAKSVVQRLPESKRRAIYAALVRSQDRATREAEAKYPIDASNIPLDKLKTYDFKGAAEKYMREDEKLRVKYEQELLQKNGITKDELDEITKEAMTEQWPLPPPD